MISNERLLLSLLSGLGAFAAVWFAYIWAMREGWPELLARNLAFTTLILGQVGLVLAERSEGRFARAARVNRLVPLLLSLTVCSALLPYVPGAQSLLHLAPLNLPEWLLAAGLAMALGTWAELVQLLGRVVARRTSRPAGAPHQQAVTRT